jgi:dipeptidyl aminopeptidase/acylaminoacyl peptidase
VVDVASGEFSRLTDALSPAIDEDELVAAEVVRYRSFNGLEIPALLYRPHQASRKDPVPALVWVHGGPGGQSRRGYNPTLQHLVNHGYAVLAVNNRGSSGYGKTFFHADDKRHGDVDLQDCIYGRRYLESLSWVDGERVGIMGGSYGGYMVCAALAFAPDAFDLGIDIFGVTNWIRTLESIPPWWASARDDLYAELGDPVEDRASLASRSPLLHAGWIEKPLLVIQGENDPRVLEVESEEIVAAVKAKGVPVEYVLFPDEGHGFRNKENRIRASEAYLAFLETHLRGAPSN